jgi:hypothetical protein
LWADFADHSGIGDIAFALIWDVPILDRFEGVGAVYTLFVFMYRMVANALA